MRTFITIALFLLTSTSFAQAATTGFEDPEAFPNKYTDTGNAGLAHDLVNNVDEPLVDFVQNAWEIGFNARYEPYDVPTEGLTDGAFVGVTDVEPAPGIGFPWGSQGYQISDVDGNFILEFDVVNLNQTTNPILYMYIAFAINGDGSSGNYEGDGTVNEPGSDRLRVYIKDLTTNIETDVINSTGFDLDTFVPTDGTNYIVAWQEYSGQMEVGSDVQLVIEARLNEENEAIFFDNINYGVALGVEDFNQNPFNIFPNPATAGYVNISAPFAGDKSVAVYDVIGKEVINTTMSGDRLNISDLDSGLYVLKITQGNASASKKLVVK